MIPDSGRVFDFPEANFMARLDLPRSTSEQPVIRSEWQVPSKLLIAPAAKTQLTTLGCCTTAVLEGRAVCSSGLRCRQRFPSPMECVQRDTD
jgi:hypothetical protein